MVLRRFASLEENVIEVREVVLEDRCRFLFIFDRYEKKTDGADGSEPGEREDRDTDGRGDRDREDRRCRREEKHRESGGFADLRGGQERGSTEPCVQIFRVRAP